MYLTSQSRDYISRREEGKKTDLCMQAVCFVCRRRLSITSCYFCGHDSISLNREEIRSLDNDSNGALLLRMELPILI